MKEQIKDKILDTSRQLFNEKGYHNVSMREIAHSLNISVGNLTYHFNKKEDILKELMKNAAPLSKQKKVTSLIDLNQYIYEMLDSIRQYLFFFVSDELSDIDLSFSYANQEKVSLLKINFIEMILELKDEGYFCENLSYQTICALVEMIMLAHLSWARKVNNKGFDFFPIQQFINIHWDIFRPFFTEKAQMEFMLFSHDENHN